MAILDSKDLEKHEFISEETVQSSSLKEEQLKEVILIESSFWNEKDKVELKDTTL